MVSLMSMVWIDWFGEVERSRPVGREEEGIAEAIGSGCKGRGDE